MELIDSLYDSLDGASALSQGRFLHNTTQTQKKGGQTFMPRVEFEPKIPVSEQAKTFHALRLVYT
jgi:hypothetical protein